MQVCMRSSAPARFPWRVKARTCSMQARLKWAYSLVDSGGWWMVDGGLLNAIDFSAPWQCGRTWATEACSRPTLNGAAYRRELLVRCAQRRSGLRLASDNLEAAPLVEHCRQWPKAEIRSSSEWGVGSLNPHPVSRTDSRDMVLRTCRLGVVRRLYCLAHTARSVSVLR